MASQFPSSSLRLPPLLPLLVTAPVASGFQSLSLCQRCAAWRGGRPIAHSSRLSNRLRANSNRHPECGGRLKCRAPTYRTGHTPYRTRPRACARLVNRRLSVNCGWLCVAGLPTPRAPTHDLSNRPTGGLSLSPQLWRALEAQGSRLSNSPRAQRGSHQYLLSWFKRQLTVNGNVNTGLVSKGDFSSTLITPGIRLRHRFKTHRSIRAITVMV